MKSDYDQPDYGRAAFMQESPFAPLWRNRVCPHRGKKRLKWMVDDEGQWWLYDKQDKKHECLKEN